MERTLENEMSEFLSVAVKSARAAGEVIVANLGKVSRDDISAKQASDFVTRIDKESEQLIVTAIKQKFPHHSFLTEESVKESIEDGYRWIIDPLDGTTNYIHG